MSMSIKILENIHQNMNKEGNSKIIKVTIRVSLCHILPLP